MKKLRSEILLTHHNGPSLWNHPDEFGNRLISCVILINEFLVWCNDMQRIAYTFLRVVSICIFEQRANLNPRRPDPSMGRRQRGSVCRF